jgi:cancer susceptibility candidate protein 1
LPDSVSWFEPPIVCRFETEEEFQEIKLLEEQMKKKIRKDDDELEDIEDEEVNVQETKKENVVRKPAKERKIKVVEDFNLLDVPKKISLQPLFEEFVVPMLPDGYEIKFEPKKTYDIGRKSYKDNKIYTIDDIVYQTRQPRSLFPNCGTKKILKVVKNRSRFELSPGLDFSSDEENDESMYSIDSDQMSTNTNVYMFSKFMRDLEDLIDLENPSFEKKITEMSSNLSMTSEINERGTDRKDSAVSLTKTNSKSLLDVSSEGDSEAESDTDNEEQEEEHSTNAMIDAMVKDANIKRCSGRWSTRDIHDIKFNEDKLTIQFRTGRLGHFAFASNRYSNFPYQSWESKPEFKM